MASGYEDANDPMRQAYEFAWSGFQQAELEAAEMFGAATAFLPANPEETGADDPVTSTVDGMELVSEASITTYEIVDVSVAMHGLARAVELQQMVTITTTTPIGGTPDMEVTIQNGAALLDTSFQPPLYTGEEYVRPPIRLEMSADGEDIAGMHLADPGRPATYDKLLEAREDQKRYAGLLSAVHAARLRRGEITA